MTGTRRSRSRIGGALLLPVLALTAGGVWVAQADGGSGHPTAAVVNAQAVAATPTQTPAPTATPTPVDLNAVLASAAAQVPAEGAVSVAVLDAASGASAVYGGGSFVTASIVKADLLAALLWQRQRAGRELSADEKATAALMIEQSDNDAADALWRAVGGAAGLDEANAAFGLTATTAGTDGSWGLTSTTAADQLRLLQVVFGSGSGSGSPLTAGSQAYLQSLMGQVEADQDWGVSAADQDGAYTLKNGWLPRSATGRWAVNSIGRVTYDGRELLLAVLTEGSADEAAGIATVEGLAKAAAGALTGELTH
ncbi:serine hydrolase [Kitasatospora sp. NPDC051853]|uniref:serine hydrolase n=1 Tax=Kitasatospora sp. NPDC051853 TaxID=3364058 RepID=UPI00379DCCA3